MSYAAPFRKNLIAVSRSTGTYDFDGKRTCTRCKARRSLKGGKTHNGSRFVCASCRAKAEGAK